MRCFKITDTRVFMSALFTKPTFDRMSVEEIQIVAANTYQIDGRTVPDFYTQEEKDAMPDGLAKYSLWEQLRPLCFTIIKGKKAPVSFRITLHAPETLLNQLSASEDCTIPPEQIQALVCTVRYADGICRIITGSSYKTFLTDKSLDHIWDEHFRRFLTNQALSFEEE